MYAVIEKSPEGSYLIKPLKQKQFVDGLCYLLQEIYGIENKNMERMKVCAFSGEIKLVFVMSLLDVCLSIGYL